MTTPARWQHVITDAGHHLRLIGANGEAVLTSEVYGDAASAVHALRVARASFLAGRSHRHPELVDERRPTADALVDVASLDAAHDLYTAALADGHYPDEDVDRPHEVEVIRLDRVGERHHCLACGYSGSTPPPLPCPGPAGDTERIVGDQGGVRTVVIPGPLPSQGSITLGPRVDRGPGHEAE